MMSKIQLPQHINKETTILVAVSGGADSMVLLHLLQAKSKVIVAHVNYGLRGEASSLDQQLVKDYCAPNNLPIEMYNVQAHELQKENSIQNQARNIRYNWFKELYKKYNCNYLATAHHANDNIETLLVNMARGAGLQGLAVMQTLDELQGMQIFRPLLNYTKEEIIAYANQNNITWRLDASNLKNNYTRNKIRNELLPLWEKIDERVYSGLQHTIQNLQKALQVQNQYLKKIITQVKANNKISIAALQKLEICSEVLYAILQPLAFTPKSIIEVLKLLDAPNGKMIQSPNWKIIKHNKHLILAPNTAIEEDLLVIDNEKMLVQTKTFNLNLAINDDLIFSNNPLKIALDAHKVNFPLVLRKWKMGDYFFPLGMHKKKKVARFLIDEKASIIEKENTWVLESNKKIIWVLGKRIDDRFKINKATLKALHINLKYEL